MAWAKSSPRLIAAFDALVPPPPAERRKMFGYSCAFVNGQMFMGLWQEELILRFAEGERAALLRLGGKPFEPMEGRPMREYVSVPEKLIYDPAGLNPWVDKSLAYARSLPPKATKKKSAAKARGKAEAAKPAARVAAMPRVAKVRGVKKRNPARKPVDAAAQKLEKSKPGKAITGARTAAKPKASSRSRAKPRTGR